MAGQDRVFAVGDVATADHKMAGIAERQAQLVADNIRALITGDGDLGVATSRRRLPSSCRSGRRAARASGPAATIWSRAEFVAQAKGRDMMVDRFAELLGVAGQTGEAARNR